MSEFTCAPILLIGFNRPDFMAAQIAVARKLDEFLARPSVRGTFHATCEGEASWAEFAAEIFRVADRDQKIQPCTTEEFPRPAPRPKNSRLEKLALRENGFSPMPDWHDALAEFMSLETF